MRNIAPFSGAATLSGNLLRVVSENDSKSHVLYLPPDRQ